MSMSPPPPPPPPPPPSFGGLPPTPYATGQVGRRRGKGVTILLTVVTFGVWTMVWAYQNGEELRRYSGRGLGGVAHLLITFFVAPVTMFLLAGEVEQLYRAEGKHPPITMLWGLWFLLPLIGNIIWYVQIQDAINDYWTAKGQTNEPGL